MTLADVARKVPNSARRATILLEVVLAMALFFSAAAVIVCSIDSSFVAVQRMRLEARGADLAVTLLSQMQLGLTATDQPATQTFEDPALADWTWTSVATTTVNTIANVQLTRVEIAVTNKAEHYTYRLAEMLLPPDVEEEPAGELAAEGVP